jgi:hypothetical protein
MISDNMSFTLLRHLELNIAKPVRLAKLLERLPALAHLTLTFRGVGEGRTTDHTNEGTTTTAHQSIANLVLKIPPILSGVDITAIRDTFGTIASSLKDINRLIVLLEDDEHWTEADIRNVDRLGLDRFTTAAKQSVLISSGSEAAGYYGDWVKGFDEVVVMGASVRIGQQFANSVSTDIG